MRKLVVGAALVGSLILSQSALADHRFSQFGYGHGNFNSRGFDRRFNRNFGNHFYGPRVNPYHYGAYSRGRNTFVSYSYGNRFNRFDRRGWNGGDFVGGLVVGSLLSNSYSQPRVTERVVYRSAPVRQEVVYVNRSQPAVVASPRRKLLRDLQGNCYQIDITPNGDEIRTELAPQECSF